jgi:hypothetical protein
MTKDEVVAKFKRERIAKLEAMDIGRITEIAKGIVDRGENVLRRRRVRRRGDEDRAEALS